MRGIPHGNGVGTAGMSQEKRSGSCDSKHFLSVLASTANNFPLALWDQLLLQTEITVNLLRQSNATPNVSAYVHFSRSFDYNKMPVAPIGCTVQVIEKTDAHGTWSYHSVDEWYPATPPEH